MVALPNAYGWAVADNVTAQLMNSQLRDGFGWFLNAPVAIVYSTTAITLTGGPNTYSWNSVTVDTDGMFSGVTPTQLTAQTPGIYMINAHMRWQPLSNGQRAIYVNVNGVVAGYHQTETETDNTVQSNDVRIAKYLGVGDYIELQVENTLILSSASTIGGAGSFLSARWLTGG